MHDELDLQIAHLLQIDARIPWAVASDILGVSASSLARRWARLTDEGLAWITTYPNPFTTGVISFIDVQCAPGDRARIVETLARHPRVLSLDECAGDRDLLLTVMTPEQADLSTFVLDTLSTVPGVITIRCSVVTTMHSEGSSWRVDALDSKQRAAATALIARPARPTSSPRPDPRLLAALAVDGRASVAALAREVGRPASTVHRELCQLREHRHVVSRCDVAPHLSGWSLEWSWFTNLPIGAKAAVVETLRTRPELRLCMSVAGRSNLVFSIRGRQFDDLAHFEQFLAASHPGLTPTEVMVHLRPRKRMGWLLTPEGRTTGEVIPPDFFGSLRDCPLTPSEAV